MVLSSGVEIGDRLVPRNGRRLVDPDRERTRNSTTEEVRRCWIQDSDDVVGRGRDVRIEVIADVTELGRSQAVDVERRSQEAQLLAAKPDEPQLVQWIDVLIF